LAKLAASTATQRTGPAHRTEASSTLPPFTAAAWPRPKEPLLLLLLLLLPLLLTTLPSLFD
jgi:hypothetical protein